MDPTGAVCGFLNWLRDDRNGTIGHGSIPWSDPDRSKVIVSTEGTNWGPVQLLVPKAGHAACCTCFPDAARVTFHRYPFLGAQWCCPSPAVAAVRVGVWLGKNRHHCPTQGTWNQMGLQMCPNPFHWRSWLLFLRLQLLRTLVADFVGNVVWGMQRQQFFALQANWALRVHLGYM